MKLEMQERRGEECKKRKKKREKKTILTTNKRVQTRSNEELEIMIFI